MTITTQIYANVPTFEALDGEITTVTITAGCATSLEAANTVDDVFVTTWRHECQDTVINTSVLTPSTLSANLLGSND